MKRIINALSGKCPRCYQGKIWLYPSYHLKHLFKMKPVCEHCGQKNVPELGFYEGAMYVSYAINVAQVITFFTAFNVLFKTINFDWLIAITISSVILMAPLTYRTSKNIWFYLFVSHDPKSQKSQ